MEPSAPPFIQQIDMNDVEIVQEYTSNVQVLRENNNFSCNRKIIINCLLIFWFICSITYIIYLHHKFLGFYIGKIKDIM